MALLSIPRSTGGEGPSRSIGLALGVGLPTVILAGIELVGFYDLPFIDDAAATMQWGLALLVAGFGLRRVRPER